MNLNDSPLHFSSEFSGKLFSQNWQEEIEFQRQRWVDCSNNVESLDKMLLQLKFLKSPKSYCSLPAIKDWWRKDWAGVTDMAIDPSSISIEELEIYFKLKILQLRLWIRSSLIYTAR